MDQNQSHPQNADAGPPNNNLGLGEMPGGVNPQSLGSEAHSQAQSQNGDYMLTGLATNRGNEGHDGMGNSVVDQSRYDQHHQDMTQSQNNFNANGYGMLGGMQPNMGAGSSNLPGMQGQDPNSGGQGFPGSGGPHGSNPMPQLQQLMMLLQQNQQNTAPPGQPSGQNNASFGAGLMQAAQMLAQSQNQASRFDNSQKDVYRMNAGGPGQFDQTSIMNQSLNFGAHGLPSQPNKGMPGAGFMNVPDGNNTHSAADMQQHLGASQYRMHDQMQAQQSRDFHHRDMGSISSMQAPQNQWMNANMHSQVLNQYIPGGAGGMNAPPQHNVQQPMPGSRGPPGMPDQANSPQVPWAAGHQMQMPPQRGLDNAYDLQNMSMASMTPQPIEQQMKAQQQAYPSHFSTFLQDDRGSQGPVGMGPSNQKPQSSFDHRDNLGQNREKFFTDDFGQRDRMSSMNMGPSQPEDGMSNGRGAGVAWLSQQNKQSSEYQQNDKFKMQEKPNQGQPVNNNGSGGIMWVSAQNKNNNEEEDNTSNQQEQPAIVWPSRVQQQEHEVSSEYTLKGAMPQNRGKYDSKGEDSRSQKYARENQTPEDYHQFYNKFSNQMDLNGSQNFGAPNENARYSGQNANPRSTEEQHQTSGHSGGAKGQNPAQLNNLNSGRLGGSNESAGGITPTNIGKAPELGALNTQSQDSVKRNRGGRDGQSDNLMDEDAFKNGDGEQFDNEGTPKDNARAANAIDDIPIPVSKPKTFEELLEEEMAKGNAGGIIANPRSPSKQHQDGSAAGKKEFLKRKNAAYGIPTGRQKSTGKKSYRYYADNFEQSSKREPSRGGGGGGPKFESSQGGKPTFNQWQQQMSEEQENNRVQKSPNSSHGAVVKRPFLARGSGKAGGKGLKSSNSKTPLRQQAGKDSGTAPGMKSPLNNEFLYDQNPQSQSNFESQLDTFKNLEDRAREQSKNLQSTYLQNQKKNQKLFEDDSEEENDSTSDPKEIKDQHPLDMEDNRSNLVKKMFYKDKEQNLRKSGVESQNSQYRGTPASSVANMPDSVQRMLEDKKEQLDKAMKFYNSEQQKLNSQKLQYDQQMKKLRIDQRELEVQRKRQKEQFDKVKEEEMAKIKAQKRIIEQRQKNVTLANNSSKRDKDEIESLRKQLTAVKDELAQKEKYSKAQIDRLNRQLNDLRAENGELRDEIGHYDQELRELREQQFNQQMDDNQAGVSQGPGGNNRHQQYTGIGQGVLNRRGSRNSGSAQRQNSNTRNSNPTSGAQKQSRQSVQNRQTSIEEFQNQEKQIKDQEDYSGSHLISRGNDPQNRLQGHDNSLANISEVNDQHQAQEEGETPQMPGDCEDQAADHMENDEEDYEMKFPHNYHNKDAENTKVQDQIVGNDGKVQRTYLNGKKEVIFSNGVRRETFPDGYTIVYFNNSDIKQTFPDQKIVYYFAEAKTTQTTYADGLQVFKFSNQQIEKHYSDGTKEIIFPDGTIKCIFADGEEESIFTDGTIQRIEKNGVKAIEYASGQKDILYPDGTRVREYPDGRIKTTYADGTTENQVKPEVA